MKNFISVQCHVTATRKNTSFINNKISFKLIDFGTKFIQLTTLVIINQRSK